MVEGILVDLLYKSMAQYIGERVSTANGCEIKNWLRPQAAP